MKPSTKCDLGKALIFISLLAIPIGFYQVMPKGLVDFPADRGVLQPVKDPAIRLAYSFSVLGRDPLGGSAYGHGTSKQYEITVGDLNFRRGQQTLYVNGHPINPGEVYETTRWALSISPWFVLTNRFIVRNEGLVSADSTSAANVLFISGRVLRGWFANPIGFIMLVSGIWLYRRGKKESQYQSP